LNGDDLSELDKITDKVVTYLNSKPGVINVQKSIKPGTSKLTFVPDYQKLAANGVTIDTAGLYLRMFASGMTIKSVTWNDEKTDIVFRTGDGLKTPEDAGSIIIPNQQGEQIPLLSLGTLTLEANPTTIAHQNTKREIEVVAGVSAGYSASTINSDLLKYTKSLTLPDGYAWQTGGANEENQKSVMSILQAMLLSALLIITTMVIQFRSYRKAAIVMSVIPVAVSGVLALFALIGTPLSFPALIGILSLFGIVVTHAMMLIDKINRNLSSGMPFNEALADGAASRLEPVFIGSFTTIIGLIPISLSNPLWRGLGGAIIAGLAFSGVVMLFLIPVIFYMVYHRDYTKKV
jgi:multidrug efflux pump subunit AcrB